MKIVKKQERVISVDLKEDTRRKDMEMARDNRRLLDEKGIVAIDVMGSVGSGKTSFLQQVAKQLKGKRIAAIAGDLTTSIDAQRIIDAGITETIQVNTGRMCHLDSIIVRQALDQLDLDKLGVLFIENVGNLICPAGFPLGSHKKVVVISVTEGPYMVVKHPHMFLDADVVLINKVDLAAAMGVDPDALVRDVHNLKPSIKVVKTSCTRGDGIDKAIEALGL